MVAVEHDHPGAGAEHGPANVADRLVEPVEAHQARERRRLAARDHEPVEAGELLGLAHLDHLGAEAAQHRRVLAEVALHGENADPERLHRQQMVAPCEAGRRCAVARRSSLALAVCSRRRTWGIADFSGGLVVAAAADDRGHGDLPGGRVRGAPGRARGRRRRARRPLVRARARSPGSAAAPASRRSTRRSRSGR